MFRLDGAVVCDDEIASGEDEEAEEDCEESDIICPALNAPDGPLRVPNYRGCVDRTCLLGREASPCRGTSLIVMISAGVVPCVAIGERQQQHSVPLGKPVMRDTSLGNGQRCEMSNVYI